MISIQQMNYVLVLSEELNFSRASERCFVTQPTLSMQIKKAEEQLGERIFDRDQTPISLTSYGTKLLPAIRAVLNEYDSIEVITKKHKGTYKEVIRLGVIPTVASYLIPDMYDLWREKLANIQLIIEELKTEDLLAALEHGQLDLGILSGPINDNRLRINPLYTEEIKAYYPAGKSNSIKTIELSEIHPWLLTPGNCLRTQMMHFCQLKNETLLDEWDYQGGNIDLLIEMVDKNGGYTLVPEKHIRTLSPNYKSIVSDAGELPAREIIAISSNRSSKWESMEKIIRECQLKYYTTRGENFTTLSWT